MSEKYKALNFIEEFIEEDLKNEKHGGRIHTRFPPEPNGFLHIGHVKAICINFELAKKYGGVTNLRFDDTNPTTESTEYVDNIKKDIKWLGYDWADREYYASDYFPKLYQFAIKLIEEGKAYVDDSSAEQIAEMKGDINSPGVNSPYRERSIEENLDLFTKMKEGTFADGEKVLRAKVDMSSPNLHMRDPVIYRIKHAHHHRTGDDWCIYPMYDFAHGQSDSIEEITHSLCSLEFIHHRELYNWFIEQLEIFPSRQIEFARMNVEYLITSKRKLLKLVEDGVVTGWDDPRMPTISGMRRRGIPAKALRVFADKVGVAKRDNLIEMSLLDSCVREELNKVATRVMVVEDPMKLVITNFPEGHTEYIATDNNPEDPEAGKRMLSLSRELWIERKDYKEDANKKYFGLSAGRDVRLKSGFIIHCTGAVKNDAGEVTEVHATYYPDSKSGEDTSGIRPKGTLHWVNAADAVPIKVANYDKLFTDPTPTNHEDKEYTEFINPDSLEMNEKALAEASIGKMADGTYLQFFRKGYYIRDEKNPDVYNKTISLKDGFKKK